VRKNLFAMAAIATSGDASSDDRARDAAPRADAAPDAASDVGGERDAARERRPRRRRDTRRRLAGRRLHPQRPDLSAPRWRRRRHSRPGGGAACVPCAPAAVCRADDDCDDADTRTPDACPDGRCVADLGDDVGALDLLDLDADVDGLADALEAGEADPATPAVGTADVPDDSDEDGLGDRRERLADADGDGKRASIDPGSDRNHRDDRAEGDAARDGDRPTRTAAPAPLTSPSCARRASLRRTSGSSPAAPASASCGACSI
jgi:hypothetical protein